MSVRMLSTRALQLVLNQMAIYKSRGGIQLSKQLVITVDIQTYDLEYSEKNLNHHLTYLLFIQSLHKEYIVLPCTSQRLRMVTGPVENVISSL